MRSAAIAVLLSAALAGWPDAAQAHGDPASDYLLVQSVFLPFNAKVDSGATADLSDTIREADKVGFRIKVAVIGTRYDLGTAFSLYNKPQKYAEFLGLELSFQYRDRLLVVMPEGFGSSIDGRPDPRGIKVVKRLPAPGMDTTKQVEAATEAVRRLAAASGHVLAKGSGGGSATRDRITIAAAVTALIALLAASVLFRRGRTAKVG